MDGNDLYSVSVPIQYELIHKSFNIYMLIIALCILTIILLGISLKTFKRTFRTMTLVLSVPILVLFIWVYLIQTSDDWTSGNEEITIYPFRQTDEVPYVPVAFQ
jgi:hypothetical protein